MNDEKKLRNIPLTSKRKLKSSNISVGNVLAVTEKKIMWECEHKNLTDISGVCSHCHEIEIRKAKKGVFDSLLGLYHQYETQNYSDKQLLKRLVRSIKTGKRKNEGTQ